MANGLNQCNFLGNLGADPEFRVTQSGRGVLKFRIACSEPRKNQDGSWGEHVEWIPVVVWGRRAEGLNQFLVKGHTVMVVGRMRTSSYEDRDGNKRYRTEIHADEVVVPGNRREGGGGGGGNGGQRRATRRPQNEQGQSSGGGGGGGGGSYPDADYGPSGDDDDIPF